MESATKNEAISHIIKNGALLVSNGQKLPAQFRSDLMKGVKSGFLTHVKKGEIGTHISYMSKEPSNSPVIKYLDEIFYETTNANFSLEKRLIAARRAMSIVNSILA